MSHIEIYRANALAERTAAEKSDLFNRKLMHERSAHIWEEMARRAEETAARTAVNQANKLQPIS